MSSMTDNSTAGALNTSAMMSSMSHDNQDDNQVMVMLMMGKVVYRIDRHV